MYLVTRDKVLIYFNRFVMDALKKHFIFVTLVALMLQVLVNRVTFAASVGDVIINEVAWAGTADNSNDEWIELYNNTNQSIDLSGWYVEDDGASSYTIAGGVITPHGYFLIEDTDETVDGVSADAVAGLSLANAGDSLILKNPAGIAMDTVNASGGAWYAGDGASKSTMERIDPMNFSDNASNWASATSGNGAVGRSGSEILGTPKGANSNFSGGTRVLLSASEAELSGGKTFTVSVDADRVADLYAYGFEVNYDPGVVTFVSASESNFLKSDGISTSFNAALENDIQGKLIIGNARLQNPPSGIDGSGELLTMDFEVVGSDGSDVNISFGGSSFLAGASGDIPASFTPLIMAIGRSTDVTSVGGLNIDLGTSLYSFELNWVAPSSGADKYIIKRLLPNGNFVALGETASLSFTDDDNIINGGDIVPNITYKYQVIPVKNGETGPVSEITATENRGLIGDNDRSGRVDGRDLEKLARSYGSGFGDEEYNPLTDTTFDGMVDGSDLIDIGANFGMKV